MNANDFVSIDHILADVTATVNDAEYKKGFSKGWYVSRIQDAMQELSFDTFWLKIQQDIEIPESCQIPMPKNVFNIREIYLYVNQKAVSLCTGKGFLIIRLVVVVIRLRLKMMEATLEIYFNQIKEYTIETLVGFMVQNTTIM